MDFFKGISDKYTEIWKNLIAPQKQRYFLSDLGPKIQIIRSTAIVRNDFEIKNLRGETLQCTMFAPEKYDPKQIGCVIYLHGNAGSRIEALTTLQYLLPRTALFCFDFAGAGKSEGDYVTLGVREADDLSVIVDYIKKKIGVSKIALWGRSMGAATAINFCANKKDSSIAAVALDSSFIKLNTLLEEIGKQRTKIPGFLIETALLLIRSKITTELKGLDIFSLDLVEQIKKITYLQGIIFGTSEVDSVIMPYHTVTLFESYEGEKQLVLFKGDHNTLRPPHFLKKVVEFLEKRLYGSDMNPCTINMEVEHNLDKEREQHETKNVLFSRTASVFPSIFKKQEMKLEGNKSEFYNTSNSNKFQFNMSKSSKEQSSLLSTLPTSSPANHIQTLRTMRTDLSTRRATNDILLLNNHQNESLRNSQNESFIRSQLEHNNIKDKLSSNSSFEFLQAGQHSNNVSAPKTPYNQILPQKSKSEYSFQNSKLIKFVCTKQQTQESMEKISSIPEKLLTSTGMENMEQQVMNEQHQEERVFGMRSYSADKSKDFLIKRVVEQIEPRNHSFVQNSSQMEIQHSIQKKREHTPSFSPFMKQPILENIQEEPQIEARRSIKNEYNQIASGKGRNFPSKLLKQSLLNKNESASTRSVPQAPLQIQKPQSTKTDTQTNSQFDFSRQQLQSENNISQQSNQNLSILDPKCPVIQVSFPLASIIMSSREDTDQDQSIRISGLDHENFEEHNSKIEMPKHSSSVRTLQEIKSQDSNKIINLNGLSSISEQQIQSLMNKYNIYQQTITNQISPPESSRIKDCEFTPRKTQKENEKAQIGKFSPTIIRSTLSPSQDHLIKTQVISLHNEALQQDDPRFHKNISFEVPLPTRLHTQVINHVSRNESPNFTKQLFNNNAGTSSFNSENILQSQDQNQSLAFFEEGNHSKIFLLNNLPININNNNNNNSATSTKIIDVKNQQMNFTLSSKSTNSLNKAFSLSNRYNQFNNNQQPQLSHSTKKGGIDFQQSIPSQIHNLLLVQSIKSPRLPSQEQLKVDSSIGNSKGLCLPENKSISMLINNNDGMSNIPKITTQYGELSNYPKGIEKQNSISPQIKFNEIIQHHSSNSSFNFSINKNQINSNLSLNNTRKISFQGEILQQQQEQQQLQLQQVKNQQQKQITNLNLENQETDLINFNQNPQINQRAPNQIQGIKFQIFGHSTKQRQDNFSHLQGSRGQSTESPHTQQNHQQQQQLQKCKQQQQLGSIKEENNLLSAVRYMHSTSHHQQQQQEEEQQLQQQKALKQKQQLQMSNGQTQQQYNQLFQQQLQHYQEKKSGNDKNNNNLNNSQKTKIILSQNQIFQQKDETGSANVFHQDNFLQKSNRNNIKTSSHLNFNANNKNNSTTSNQNFNNNSFIFNNTVIYPLNPKISNLTISPYQNQQKF